MIEKDRDRLHRLVRYAADEVAAVEGRIDREAYREMFATQEVRRLLDAAALGLEAMAGVGHQSSSYDLLAKTGSLYGRTSRTAPGGRGRGTGPG